MRGNCPSEMEGAEQRLFVRVSSNFSMMNKGVSMHERSLNEAERILATHKDVVVPVKEIWLEVSKQGQLQRFEVPPLVDFTALLEGDDRFEFFPAGDELGDEYVEPTDEDEVDYSTDMERLGLYSEDRVRLRNIEVSEELVEELAEEPEGLDERREAGERTDERATRQSRPTPPAIQQISKHRTSGKLKSDRSKIKKGKKTVRGSASKRRGKAR